MPHRADAQESSGISMPTLQIRALGIDTEVRQINSLLGLQAKFLKRRYDLNHASLSFDKRRSLQTNRQKGSLTSQHSRTSLNL